MRMEITGYLRYNPLSKIIHDMKGKDILNSKSEGKAVVIRLSGNFEINDYR